MKSIKTLKTLWPQIQILIFQERETNEKNVSGMKVLCDDHYDVLYNHMVAREPLAKFNALMIFALITAYLPR